MIADRKKSVYNRRGKRGRKGNHSGLQARKDTQMEATMQKYAKMSGSTLKIIALVSMLIDHMAAVLLPYPMMEHGVYYLGFSLEYAATVLGEGPAGWLYILYQIMRRLLGRLAFPIYCFLLVEGFERTHSRAKYALRLFLFTIISEVPFDLAFNGRIFYTHYQNVFFTLFLGVLMM